jgi:hypothetical protein
LRVKLVGTLYLASEDPATSVSNEETKKERQEGEVAV